MPHYNYKCFNCNYSFELFQMMSDSIKKKCPHCKKMKLKRLISGGSGIIFKKGSGGFYCKDYPKEVPPKPKTTTDKKIKKGPAKTQKQG